MDVLKFYGDLEREEYLYDSEIGKKRIKEIEEIFDEIKPYLGKVVLDIGCGAGLFSFYLEEKGYKVIGIDMSKEMIKEAMRIKRKYNFKTIFLLADATKLKLKTKIDSAIILGNTLWDFSPKDFVNLVKSLKRNSNKNFYILIQYRSLIYEVIYKDALKTSFPYKNVAEIFERYDDFESRIYWRYIDLEYKKLSTSKSFTTWSVGFLEAIMEALDFKLEKRIKSDTIYTDWLDVYKLETI
ncbi:MAG: class I SAM-dependent methyltransferase [Candidatus Aenigmatarchaeota archaeon]